MNYIFFLLTALFSFKNRIHEHLNDLNISKLSQSFNTNSPQLTMLNLSKIKEYPHSITLAFIYEPKEYNLQYLINNFQINALIDSKGTFILDSSDFKLIRSGLGSFEIGFSLPMNRIYSCFWTFFDLKSKIFEFNMNINPEINHSISYLKSISFNPFINIFYHTCFL